MKQKLALLPVTFAPLLHSQAEPGASAGHDSSGKLSGCRKRDEAVRGRSCPRSESWLETAGRRHPRVCAPLTRCAPFRPAAPTSIRRCSNRCLRLLSQQLALHDQRTARSGRTPRFLSRHRRGRSPTSATNGGWGNQASHQFDQPRKATRWARLRRPTWEREGRWTWVALRTDHLCSCGRSRRLWLLRRRQQGPTQPRRI